MTRPALVLSLLLCAVVPSLADNLVSDPSFEAGGSGWKFDNFGIPTWGPDNRASHSGQYGISTGCGSSDCITGPESFLWQNIATVPGQQYTFTFWSMVTPNPPGPSANALRVSAGGAILSDASNLPADGVFRQATFVFTATSASTRIEFNGRDNRGGLYVDDVCVDVNSSAGACGQNANSTPTSLYIFTTNPPGLLITVDGVTMTTPRTYSWDQGSQHTVDVPTPQGSGTTRQAFANWSDAGARSHTFTVTTDVTDTATFITQYQLTTTANSPHTIGANPTSTDGFYAAGTSVQLTAIPASGYQLSAWTGSLSGSTNPQTIVMSAPRSVGAAFAQQTSAIIVTTNPPGLTISVDGQTTVSPQTYQWVAGTQHSINSVTPQGNGSSRYTYSNWSDSGAQNHLVTAPSASATYTANFTAEHHLSLTASNGNAVTANPTSGDGFYASGTSVQLTAVPASGYLFANWTGDLSGSVNPQTVVLSAPRSVTGVFSQPTSTITLNTNPPGLTITVDGQSAATPQTLQWVVGSQHSINSATTQGDGSTRYRFSNWSDSGAQSHSVTVAATPATYTASFTTEHHLSLTVPIGNSITASPAAGDGFYAVGSTVQLTATPASGFQFDKWSGDLTGSPNPQTLTMTAPHSVGAAFTAIPFSISVSGTVTATVAAAGTTTGSVQIFTAGSAPALVNAAASGGSWLKLGSASITAPGALNYTLDSANLASGNYNGTITLTCAAAKPCDPVIVPVLLAVGAAKPAISQIQGSGNQSALLAQNMWIEIKGTNLSATTRTWNSTDFAANSGKLPTVIDGVSVSINGKPGYIDYVSPGQINVLTPIDSSTGTFSIVLTNALGSTTAYSSVFVDSSPALFTFDGKYVAATHVQGAVLGPVSLFPALSTPAKPGEMIVVYGTGFGQTNPPIVSGTPTQSGTLPSNPVFALGDLSLTVQFAGVVAPGLYQFNFTVPANAPDGDLALTAAYSGRTTQAGALLTVAK